MNINQLLRFLDTTSSTKVFKTPEQYGYTKYHLEITPFLVPPSIGWSANSRINLTYDEMTSKFFLSGNLAGCPIAYPVDPTVHEISDRYKEYNDFLQTVLENLPKNSRLGKQTLEEFAASINKDGKVLYNPELELIKWSGESGQLYFSANHNGHLLFGLTPVMVDFASKLKLLSFIKTFESYTNMATLFATRLQKCIEES